MTVLEEIDAFGHESILCTHKSTIELTKEGNLTKRGNCILGIRASKACVNLNSALKKKIQENNKIKIKIKVDDLVDSFYGYGSSELKMSNNKAIVFRKSNFICDRTVLINCTKSSRELNRDLVKRLSVQGKKFSIIFEVDEIK